MVQGILIMPLTMHKPPRFSVVNPSISPIIPPSRFHSLLVMGPRFTFLRALQMELIRRKGDTKSARAIVIYCRDVFYKQNAVKTLSTPCSLPTSLRSTPRSTMRGDAAAQTSRTPPHTGCHNRQPLAQLPYDTLTNTQMPHMLFNLYCAR